MTESRLTSEINSHMICRSAGLIVGCVPFLKSTMFPARGAPLGFVTTALDTIGNSFVFLISFILGAVLSKGPGHGTRMVGWSAVIMTVLNRFLFVPALGNHLPLPCPSAYVPQEVFHPVCSTQTRSSRPDRIIMEGHL